MRIAIVNDVNAIVTLLGKALKQHTDHELAWSAANGAEAVQKCAADPPDIILMDLIMPEMDGIEATRRIMAASPCAILVVTASVNGNAGKVFEAMGAGALDAISTPALSGAHARESITGLKKKIDMIGKLIAGNRRPGTSRQAPRPRQAQRDEPPLIAIGSSTGGPGALAKILAQLPKNLGAALVIIQHVDSNFAASLVAWLDEQTELPVRLATGGERPQAGQVLIAGTDQHLALGKDGRLRYTAEPKDYVYHPSVDVFFESAAAHWPREIIGVLLTGMGRDGANGLLSLHHRGMPTIAQDEHSCAVYGMPKAAAELGAADDIMPVNQIADALIARLNNAAGRLGAAGAKP